MERHRCTTCRNPIRHGGVARPRPGTGSGPDSGPDSGEHAWFHEDCWAQVCSAEQDDYERRIRENGLTALLAPYLCPHGRARAAARLATVL